MATLTVSMGSFHNHARARDFEWPAQAKEALAHLERCRCLESRCACGGPAVRGDSEAREAFLDLAAERAAQKAGLAK